MFERFTERARMVCQIAETEARDMKHQYVGTEHLLLGLLGEGEGLAARTLGEMGVRVDDVRVQIVRIVGSGEVESSERVPWTPRAKKVLEAALRVALSMGHNYIGTEHLLLGVLSEPYGVGARILADMNVTFDAAQAAAEEDASRSSPTRTVRGALAEVSQRQHDLIVARLTRALAIVDEALPLRANVGTLVYKDRMAIRLAAFEHVLGELR